MAASTKSVCLVAITLPRMTRVSDVQPKMISTSEIVQMLRVGKIARNTIAPRMKGSPKKMSVIRLMMVSVNPPNQPAAVPVSDAEDHGADRRPGWPR